MLEPRRDLTFSPVIGHDPLFQARISAVGCVGPRHDEPGCASSWPKDRRASSVPCQSEASALAHPSWLERYDAAVLQGVDELGQVRKQCLRQCPGPPATLAAERDDRRLSRGTHREQRSEISIRGHDDSMLGGSALEDHFVVGVLQC